MWLVNFIKADGFKHLMRILQTITSRYANADKSVILANKAEAKSLFIAAYTIKVILVACFCSQTKDSNLAGNL